ncbi:acyl-CoA thioester hydrolase/BAAT C-terminal domain-containing protein [Cognatiluteimonas telluris]|jgi:dienelactone hydrolase|uniref:acyl-CoA thioester hydrolase/BAAT C-terminal domain-containing protein n=1 Tax=Cognatiluteimonas telluris TaxID=1104775 RepID=UPI00140C4CFE|nr:acyl-CoA thioester hydrolase/BAAT C-terminal domain-containing protein [Lysobacter telluris]
MRVVLKLLKWIFLGIATLVLAVTGYSVYQSRTFDTATLPANYGRVATRMYLGAGQRQPLLVGLGGAEGGNAWASDHWKPERDALVGKGYAFLALGYFGLPGTPERLDRISLDAVHAAIADAARNPRIDGRCIALIGGSRGAELALALASRDDDIKAVVAMSPGSAVFVGNTPAMNTSAFTWHGKPLPFVPVPWRAVPDLLQHRLEPAFEKMLANAPAVEAAATPVERINGPVYLMSPTHDELWPSTMMARAMMRRLDARHFPYAHIHDVFVGGHAAPLQHLDRVEAFLAAQFPASDPARCARDRSASMRR